MAASLYIWRSSDSLLSSEAGVVTTLLSQAAGRRTMTSRCRGASNNTRLCWRMAFWTQRTPSWPSSLLQWCTLDRQRWVEGWGGEGNGLKSRPGWDGEWEGGRSGSRKHRHGHLPFSNDVRWTDGGEWRGGEGEGENKGVRMLVEWADRWFGWVGGWVVGCMAGWGGWLYSDPLMCCRFSGMLRHAWQRARTST